MKNIKISNKKRKCKITGYEHIEIINSTWYTPATYYPIMNGNINCIGIVNVRDNITKEIKSYIGYGLGKKIKADEDYIITSGAKFCMPVLQNFYMPVLKLPMEPKENETH